LKRKEQTPRKNIIQNERLKKESKNKMWGKSEKKLEKLQKRRIGETRKKKNIFGNKSEKIEKKSTKIEEKLKKKFRE